MLLRSTDLAFEQIANGPSRLPDGVRRHRTAENNLCGQSPAPTPARPPRWLGRCCHRPARPECSRVRGHAAPGKTIEPLVSGFACCVPGISRRFQFRCRRYLRKLRLCGFCFCKGGCFSGRFCLFRGFLGQGSGRELRSLPLGLRSFSCFTGSFTLCHDDRVGFGSLTILLQRLQFGCTSSSSTLVEIRGLECRHQYVPRTGQYRPGNHITLYAVRRRGIRS